MDEEVKIEIPKVDEKDVKILSNGEYGDIRKKLKDMHELVLSINLVVVLSMIAIIVSVIGLFLDQMRNNNATYKEYSQKTESVETTQKTNEELLRQIKELSEQNKQDREIMRLYLIK